MFPRVMAPLFSSLQKSFFSIHILLYLAIVPCTFGSYSAIFSFGDSLADTGNSLYLSPPGNRCGFPPYGQTYGYLHRPTGRCSDGKLVIDFIAESLGLPHVPPFSGGNSEHDFRQGANFAVVGATALDFEFLRKRGIRNKDTNSSLNVQLALFKNLLPSLCSTPSDCRKLLRSSLIVLGEIGGNDYNHAFFERVSTQEIRDLVPLVNSAIAQAIQELIELGAATILVPGNLPIGCLPVYLTLFESSSKEEYHPFTGCINWLNGFSQYHNHQLQKELNRIQKLHPHAQIVYVDYYNAALNLYQFPARFGFNGGELLKSCCGAGGPYNYSLSIYCGYPPLSTACADPASRVSWDGLHFTEAAYRLISKAIIHGPYSIPPLNASHIVDVSHQDPFFSNSLDF